MADGVVLQDEVVNSSGVASAGDSATDNNVGKLGDAEAPAEAELQMSDIPRLYPDYESRKTRESEDSVDFRKRDKWTNKLEFVMVLMSLAVGLGNVWKFPYTAYENGGGIFVIIYLIVVVIIARPMYMFELVLGQFTSRGPVGIWDCVPLLRGIGWAVVGIAFITSMFYAAILALTLVYLAYGFLNPLPWTRCYDDEYYLPREAAIFSIAKFSCKDYVNEIKAGKTAFKYPSPYSENDTFSISTQELFFNYVVLQKLDRIDGGLGTVSWPLGVALLLVWFLTYLNLMFGTKSYGKAAYFTTIFPYLMLFILFAKACTLEGASKGMLYFLIPDTIKDVSFVKIIFAAISQAFFSLGIGYGNAMVVGSFNPFHQKTYNHALYVGLADTLTSLFAGLTVFGSLGGLAEIAKKEVKDVAAVGSGLAFVAYPDLVSRIGSYPVPQIFSFCFFAMLATLGIGSLSGVVQVVIALLPDKIPILNTNPYYKMASCGGVCSLLAILGLVFCSQGGQQMIDIFDIYGTYFTVFITVLLQYFGIAYVYGQLNFEMDMKFMFQEYNCCRETNCRILSYWAYCIPALFIAILGYVFYEYKPPSYAILGIEYQFPNWVIILGWGMCISILLLIPIFALRTFFTRKSGSWKKKWYASVTPSKKWGPKVPEEKRGWVQFKQGYYGETWVWKKTFGRCISPFQAPLAEVSQDATPAQIVSVDTVGDGDVDKDTSSVIDKPE